MSATARDTIVFYVLYNAVGGSHHSLLGIIDGLDERWAARIVLAQSGEEVERLLARAGVPVYLQPAPLLTAAHPHSTARQSLGSQLDTLRGVFGAARRLRRLLRRSHARIVYSDGLKGSLVCGLAALGLPTRHWRHVRSAWSHGALERLAFLLDDVVVAISHAVLNRVIPWHLRHPRRCRVMPNAVDTRHFRPLPADPDLRAELGLGDRPVIGYIGRLTPWKRPEDLFRALTLLRDQYRRDVACLVVGSAFEDQDPGYLAELDRLIEELNLRNTVIMAGYQPDVRPYTSLMDVLALPSDFEPFGRAVIETQSQGVPVVATRSGGVTEIIEHDVNGLLVPVGDPPALARALERILAEPDTARRLAEAGLRSVKERFSLPDQARRVKALLDELAPPRYEGLACPCPG